MTDQEINRRLALAIGWEKDQMAEQHGFIYVADWPRKDNRKTVLQNRASYPVPFLPWKCFDYRDPAVIWPIAERFDCFPVRNMIDGWRGRGTAETADTAAKAVALAVINVRSKP